MLGIIGGTGLYKMDDLKNIKIEKVNTPYGVPSSENFEKLKFLRK